MKKLFTLLFLISFSTGSFQAFSQGELEDESPVVISGTIDTYFRGNLSAKNNLGSNSQAPGSSFANQPGFSLGMVNLIAAKEGDKVGFVADLVFGPRGTDAVFGSTTASSSIVNQLYAYWNVSPDVTLTIGNFNTYLGYEVISPAANFNYSTSYMFSYGPFSHSGIKADFNLSENVTAMLSVMNPTDATDFNPFGTYTYGAQLGAGGFYLNFLYGDQDGILDEDFATTGQTSAGSTFQVDLTGGLDISEKLYFGVNATYNTTATGEESNGTDITDLDGDGSGFLGAALYLQAQTSDAFAIGGRLEYFSEFNGGVGAIGALDTEGDGSVIDFTLTGKYSVGDLTIIPEVRIDSASEDAFLNSSLEASKSLSSFVLGAVYSF